MNRSPHLAFLFLLLLILTGLHATWTWRDQSYQSDDAGFYMEYAQEIYIVGKHEGALQALRQLYLHRHWKPVVGPIFVIPFLQITHGDTREAFRLYTAATSALVTTGLYFFLNLMAADALIAFLFTILTVFMAWMLKVFFEFGSEGPWLWSSLWFLVAVFRKGATPRAGWPAAALLVISVCCRPVESTILLVPPFWAMLFYPLRSERMRWEWNAKLCAAEVLGFGALILYPYFIMGAERSPREQGIVLAMLTAYFAVKWIWIRQRGSPAELRAQALWSAVCLSVIAWFLPGMESLISWTLISTSGRNVETSAFFHDVKYGFFLLYLKRMGLYLLAPLLFLPVIWSQMRQIWRPKVHVLWILLWIVLPFAVLCSLTNSRDFRYFQLSFLAVVGLTVASLPRSRMPQLRRIFPAIICILIALSAYSSIQMFYFGKGLENPLIRVLTFGIGDFSRTLPLGRDEANLNASAYLNHQDLPANIDIVLIDAQGGTMGLTMNPWKFTIQAREHGLFWRIKRYNEINLPTEKVEDLISEALKFGEVLWVSGALPDSHSNAQSEQNRIARALSQCVTKPCPDLGVEFVSGFVVPESERSPQSIYFLFKKIGLQAPTNKYFRCLKSL